MRRQTGSWVCGTAAALLVLGMGSATAAPAAPAAPETREAWLGVYSQTLTPELREGLNYSGSGALVSRVVDGSPAGKAGVRNGDVVVGINTTTIASASDLSRAVRDAKPGQKVSVRIVREGERRTLSTMLAERPADDFEWSEAPAPPDDAEAPEAPRFKGDGDFEFLLDDAVPGLAMFRGGRGRLGVRVENLNPDLGGYFGVANGKGALVVEVLKDTPAERAGLKAGDVITKAGDRKVENTDDLVKALRAAEKKVTLAVVRKNATRTVESELRESPRVMRFRHDGPLSFGDGDVRIHRLEREDAQDVRRELDELRRELRELKSKLEEKSRN